jgi:hypothetical protein
LKAIKSVCMQQVIVDEGASKEPQEEHLVTTGGACEVMLFPYIL